MPRYLNLEQSRENRLPAQVYRVCFSHPDIFNEIMTHVKEEEKSIKLKLAVDVLFHPER